MKSLGEVFNRVSKKNWIVIFLTTILLIGMLTITVLKDQKKTEFNTHLNNGLLQKNEEDDLVKSKAIDNNSGPNIQDNSSSRTSSGSEVLGSTAIPDVPYMAISSNTYIVGKTAPPIVLSMSDGESLSMPTVSPATQDITLNWIGESGQRQPESYSRTWTPRIFYRSSIVGPYEINLEIVSKNKAGISYTQNLKIVWPPRAVTFSSLNAGKKTVGDSIFLIAQLGLNPSPNVGSPEIELKTQWKIGCRNGSFGYETFIYNGQINYELVCELSTYEYSKVVWPIKVDVWSTVKPEGFANIYDNTTFQFEN